MRIILILLQAIIILYAIWCTFIVLDIFKYIYNEYKSNTMPRVDNTLGKLSMGSVSMTHTLGSTFSNKRGV